MAEAHLETGDALTGRSCMLSEEIGAGLIVMGSRGLGGVRRALMGSVSDSVVKACPLPCVLMVRE